MDCDWCFFHVLFFFFKQKTAYEMRISDWSSDVCSSDLLWQHRCRGTARSHARPPVPARSETPRMTRSNAAMQPPADKSLSDDEFKALLAGVIPHLRAYGRSLSGNPDLADDLTQDTMVKAWASRDRFARSEEQTSE